MGSLLGWSSGFSLWGVLAGASLVVACSATSDPPAGTGGSSNAGTGGSTSPGSGGADPATGGGGADTGGSAGATGGASGTGGLPSGGSGGTTPGTGGSDPGTGGTGGDVGTGGGSTGLVMPIERGNGRYVLEFDGLFFEVDANVGARIVTFALDGQNILTGPDAHAENYGSTLTLSPQNPSGGAVGSGWPPPAGLDTMPYQVSVEGEQVVMTSGATTVQGGTVQVTKRFTPDFVGGGVQVEYVLANVGAAAVSWAPWEISRALPDGITFFPTGDPTHRPKTELTLQDTGGWTWWPYDLADITKAGVPTHGGKIMADGSQGWLAHAAGGLLFVTRFMDIPVEQQAPGEAEISIYASRPTATVGAYVEIEPQGAFTTLQPGESLPWTVGWYLRALPEGADLVVGDPELIAFTQTLVQ